MSAVGIGCRPLPFLEFKFEPEPERDQACPALWLQGFRLLLKSCVLARYHRPELNDCLVISDATPPQPSSSPPPPPDTTACLAICPPQSPALGETQHLAYSPHLKLADRHTFMHLGWHNFFSTQLLPSCSRKSLLILLNFNTVYKHMISLGGLIILINSLQVLLYKRLLMV